MIAPSRKELVAINLLPDWLRKAGSIQTKRPNGFLSGPPVRRSAGPHATQQNATTVFERRRLSICGVGPFLEKF